jgi:uncharacterized protein (UPF0305 family)
MECLTHKSEIADTFSSVRSFSYNEKKSPLIDQERINSFLDSLLEFRKSLKEKTETIISFNDRIERITWYNDLDEECYMLINDLISTIKDLHSSLIRQYISMNYIRQKGIAKEEIREFKNTIDVLKENYQDLESVFFFLPEISEFKETTKLLSLV